jgi:hypothetical protein
MVKNVLTPWVIILAVVLAVLLFVGSASLLWSNRPESVALAPATAVITVIPAPTATLPGSTPTAAQIATPTPSETPSPLPGSIALGAYVQITGTGGDGLRLRNGPSLNGEVRFLGLEAEVFLVQDGPIEANDYTWWYLVAPYDEKREGWAVAPYLETIQNP